MLGTFTQVQRDNVERRVVNRIKVEICGRRSVSCPSNGLNHAQGTRKYSRIEQKDAILIQIVFGQIQQFESSRQNHYVATLYNLKDELICLTENNSRVIYLERQRYNSMARRDRDRGVRDVLFYIGWGAAAYVLSVYLRGEMYPSTPLKLVNGVSSSIVTRSLTAEI